MVLLHLLLLLTGPSASVRVGNSAGLRPDILATASLQRWDVMLSWTYPGCVGINKVTSWKAGELEVLLMGQPTAIITGGPVTFKYPSGSAILKGTSSTTASAGGITRCVWVWEEGVWELEYGESLAGAGRGRVVVVVMVCMV
jgi:hypothetical protein